MRIERDTEQVIEAIDKYVVAMRQRDEFIAQGRHGHVEPEKQALARALETFVDRRIDRALGR